MNEGNTFRPTKPCVVNRLVLAEICFIIPSLYFCYDIAKSKYMYLEQRVSEVYCNFW